MALRTYTKQKYGLTKPYRDNLNKMATGLEKNESLVSNYANNLYNNEVNRMNKVKQEYQNIGSQRSSDALTQPSQVTNSSSNMNQINDNRGFKGLGGKLSETSSINLMNTARNVSEQALGTTATILQGIDKDMAVAKATNNIALANATKQRFDLLYDNFYQINQNYLSYRDFLKEMEE